ncbi:hypothetical protein [Terrabacter sp. C0L_2]|uniref:hypothetical protein n=1 Tax=Terrabacter sp. C0L_2 TaxID=3108389 RepID=UPI002ECFE484|nr:hypothetical protein U5C87_00790 [Terrabacter sp. C0L_2]
MTEQHQGSESDALREAREATKDAVEAAQTAEQRVAAAQQEQQVADEPGEDDAELSRDLDEFSTSWGTRRPDVEGIDSGGGGGSSAGGTTDD